MWISNNYDQVLKALVERVASRHKQMGDFRTEMETKERINWKSAGKLRRR